MPQEKLPKQTLLAKTNDKRPVGWPRIRWTDCIVDLGWNRLELQSEIMKVVENSEVWRLNLELLPTTITEKRTMKKEEEEDNLLRCEQNTVSSLCHYWPRGLLRGKIIVVCMLIRVATFVEHYIPV